MYNVNSQGENRCSKGLKTRGAVGINTDRGRVQQLKGLGYFVGEVLVVED